MSSQIDIKFPVQALSFDGVPVHFNDDAYLHATAIATHFKKRVGDYLRNTRTQDYIKALGEYLSVAAKAVTEQNQQVIAGNPVTRKRVTEQNQLVIVIQGGSPDLQGTWIHPKLAVDFARWLSPKFAVWCDIQIEKILGINTKYHGKRTTKDKRTALHEAIALLMTKSKHLHFKDCYKIIHQRFNVNHLDEIPEDMLPEAVNFVHRLLVGDGAKPTLNEDIKANILGLVSHMLWVNSFWRHIAAPLRGINSTLAGNVHDHFAYFPWKGDAATIHQAKIRSVA